MAANLDPVGNPNGSTHLYRLDRQTNEMRLIDRSVTGGPSSWGINFRSADMSEDGRYVTYTSWSNDIVWLDMNWQAQVFRYDAAADPGIATAIVSAAADGTLADGSSYATSVSGDGRFVAFVTTASNLAAPAPPPGNGIVAVRDMADRTLTRVDVVDGGTGFDHAYPYSPAFSADVTAVAFQPNVQN